MHLPSLPALPVASQLLRTLPRLALQPISHSPFLLQRLTLERVLQNVFREAIAEGDFDFLQGKFLRVDIRDIKLCWYFSFDGSHITVHRYAKAASSISGDLHEFLLLMSRKEDPDTLFFQRRLQIDGDTELGLELKNLLDTLDEESLLPPLKFGLKTLHKLPL